MNFLPAFGSIQEKSELFDDKLYWEVRELDPVNVVEVV